LPNTTKAPKNAVFFDGVMGLATLVWSFFQSTGHELTTIHYDRAHSDRTPSEVEIDGKQRNGNVARPRAFKYSSFETTGVCGATPERLAPLQNAIVSLFPAEHMTPQLGPEHSADC
jgi:hypothetical protein